MTTTTATPAEIKVGDHVYEQVGARNWATFEVESVEMGVTRTGRIIWTCYGYRKVNAGVCGPDCFSLVEGETVEVISA
jgi:hypothetical protein